MESVTRRSTLQMTAAVAGLAALPATASSAQLSQTPAEFDHLVVRHRTVKVGDLDIFYRMARTGEPFIYEPQFAVFHDHRREITQLRRQYWTWGLAHMAFIVKSYRSDPAYQSLLRKLVRWWFADQASQLLRSLLGRHVLPPNMIALELWGGVVGLFGEYDRSVRRVAKIRNDTR